MRLIERVDEAEVIAEFLRAEIDSPRFGPRVRARIEADGREEAIVRAPDTDDADDNAYRAQLLHSYRGVGGSAPLLEGLPERIEWHRAAIARDALGEVRYIDYPYWNELSANTRSPRVAAERIRAGIMAANRPNDGFLELSARMCAGVDLGMPVLIAPDHAAPPVILEGHTRVTAMLLRPECLPDPVAFYVGFAPEVRDWMFYGTPGRGS
jgi:hypothetical protein